MKQKITKMVLIFSAIFCILFITYQPVYATTPKLSSGDQIINAGRTWLDRAKASGQSKINANQVAEVIKPVANVLLGAGSVLIVIVGVIMGIKYLSASPDQQGQLKKQLVGLFISAIVLYGAYGIWSIVYTVLNSVIG